MHDYPRFLDLIFKTETSVTFLEQVTTRLGPSCWLWLKEKIGEEEARKQGVFIISLSGISRRGHSCWPSPFVLTFHTKKLLDEYLKHLNGCDVDVEEVLLILRAGAIAEKDMVEFKNNQLLADYESPEIARYLNFHPLKT